MQYNEIDASAQWQSNDNTPAILFTRDVQDKEAGYLEMIVVAKKANTKFRVWHKTFAYRRIDNDVSQIGNTNDVVNTAQMSDFVDTQDLIAEFILNGTQVKVRVIGTNGQDTFFAVRVRGLAVTE